ncbi:MAG: OmpH family outer membrane protein [Bacteroidales bacterium]
MTTDNTNKDENQEEQEKSSAYKEVPKTSIISNGTIINVVLFIGLIVLYVFRFLPFEETETEQLQEEVMQGTADQIEQVKLNIAYVDSDSLIQNFQLAETLQRDFEQEQRRLENDLQRRQTQFQQEAETFYQQVQTGAISADQAQIREQELMQKQQELVQLNETYTNQLRNKEMQMNIELYGEITSLLEELNQELDYDYILGFSPGGGILYADDKHDITNQVIQRLNANYESISE